MENVESISSWLQLTDSSEILCYDEVDAALRRIVSGADETHVVDGPWWNREQTRPMRFNIFVVEGVPKDFAEPLDEVAQHLRDEEYLLFCQLTRFEYEGAAAASLIMVAKDFVERSSSQGIVDYLLNRAHIPEPPKEMAADLD